MIFINLKGYRFFHSEEHRFHMFHKKKAHRDSEKNEVCRSMKKSSLNQSLQSYIELDSKLNVK